MKVISENQISDDKYNRKCQRIELIYSNSQHSIFCSPATPTPNFKLVVILNAYGCPNQDQKKEFKIHKNYM